MTIDDKIGDETLQYDINREAAKISALSSGKIDKYECFAGEEILPFNQRQIIEQTTFSYSPLRRTFEKQTKTIEKQGEKQMKAIQSRVKKTFLDANQKSIASLISKDFLNEEATYELTKIVEIENKLNRDDLIYKTGNKKKEKIIRKFIRKIYYYMMHLN